MWVALKDKGRAVPDDIACKNAWKALGKGLPGELSASAIKQIIELGRRNAGARACDTSASTSASANASTSAPPSTTASNTAPPTNDKKGKRKAAISEAATSALLTVGIDISVPFADKPPGAKRHQLAVTTMLLDQLSTGAPPGGLPPAFDLPRANGKAKRYVGVTKPCDAEREVGDRQQLRRGHEVLGVADVAGGGREKRAKTLVAVGRADPKAFEDAAGELGLKICDLLDPEKTRELFISGNFTYKQFRDVKSILFDHFGRSFWSSEREVRALEKQRDKASARPNDTPVVLVSVRSDQRASVRVSAGGGGGGRVLFILFYFIFILFFYRPLCHSARSP